MPAEQEYDSRYRMKSGPVDAGYCIIQMLYDASGKPNDWIFLEVTAAFEKHHGITEATGKTIRELKPDIEDKWMECYGKVVETGESIRFREQSVAFGRVFDLYAFRAGSAEDRKVAILFTDITDRKRRGSNMAFLNDISKDLVRASNIKETMDVLGERICHHFNALSCVFNEINEATEEVVVEHEWHQEGTSSLVGRYRITELFTEDFLQTMRRGDPFILADRDTDSRVEAAKLAALRVASFVAVPIISKGQLLFAISVTDKVPRKWREDEIHLLIEITNRIWTRLERYRAEEALAKSEEKYRTLFNSIDEGFCTIEVLFDDAQNAVDYKFLETNPAFVKQTGLEDVIGKTILSLAPGHEKFWFEIYGEIALTGRPQRFEHQAVALNRWYDVFAFRIGLPEERTVAVLFIDIADRKHAEERQQQFTHTLEEQVAERTSELKETNRELQSTITQLQSFNHIASHDLQEPLRKIQVFISRMQADLPDTKRQQEYLASIYDASQRMRELIDDLLVFSRLANKQDTFRSTDLNIILKQVLSEYDELIREKQAVITSEALPTLEIIPFQIRLLFANLISNALKFCERQPEIKITYKEVDAELLRNDFPVKDFHTFAEITFTDNGIGFDNQYSKKIFGLFQRLTPRKTFQGTGIGLSIVEKVVKDHSGFVKAVGKPDEGAVFSVYLPFAR